MRLAKLALYIDEELAIRHWKYGENVFARFMSEILGRFRIPYETISSVEQIEKNEFDIVIAAFVPDTKTVGGIFKKYLEKGGTVLSLATLDQLAPSFGYRKGKTLTEGYAQYDQEKYKQLRILKAVPWISTEVPSEHTEIGSLIDTDFPLFQIFSVGEGHFSRCSVDIAETIVKLQQGACPLFEDGNPAPDKTAEVNDHFLKVDDMSQMDWDKDRKFTETNQPYFAYPYADLWKEVFVQYVCKLALAKGLTLPFVWYWPEGVKGVALISHDSDYNQDEHAYTTLRVLKEAGVRSSWCMLVPPGYSQDVYRKVIEEGHELAFHYNAVDVDDGSWGREEFTRQFSMLQQDLPGTHIVSNKNHLTRYEGWGELFEWCEEVGIQSDQTMGPSKKGNLGFLFGTCHPYFPIAWGTDKNRLYDVVEINFLTPDINTGKWGDTSIIVPFLEEVLNVSGVAHFLFHQIHLHRNEKVREAFFKVVAEMKKREFEFWTGLELNKWERLRRTIEIRGIDDEDVYYDSDKKVHNFIVYVPVDSSLEKSTEVETIFSIPCKKVVCQKGVKTHEIRS